MGSGLISHLEIETEYLIVFLFLIQILLFILLISAHMKYNRLKRGYTVFMKGKDGRNLEESIIKRPESSGMMLFRKWEETLVLHLQCWMKRIVDGFLIPCTVEMGVILILKKLSREKVMLNLQKKKKNLWSMPFFRKHMILKILI